MSRKNSNSNYTPHANWDIPGGIRNLDGERVIVTYHRPSEETAAKRKKVQHNNAMRRLRAQQAKMA